jgi:molybdenum cofactor cytidylyltransferase
MEAVIDGVILAAGLSSRMDRPKPLLKVGAVTFLARAAQTLRGAGCRRILAVVNAGADWAAAAARELDVELVPNEQVESEQVDSLRLALRQLADDVAAVLVLPVDLPLVSADTAAALVAEWRSSHAPLCVPFHNTVAGHPVLLGRELFDEILNRELEEGVRTLIMSHARDLHEVRVVDPGILIDIDTPDDYWRYIEQK